MHNFEITYFDFCLIFLVAKTSPADLLVTSVDSTEGEDGKTVQQEEVSSSEDVAPSSSEEVVLTTDATPSSSQESQDNKSGLAFVWFLYIGILGLRFSWL